MQLQHKILALNKLHAKYQRIFPFESWDSRIKEEVKHTLTYHSTKIEGLTLTYAETLKFLKNGTIKQGAKLKDLSDLRNHEEVLDLVFRAYETLAFDEHLIKELHLNLMKDPYQWEKIDPITGGAGEYKLEANATLRPGGKIHEYLPPDQVELAMKQLVLQTNHALGLASVESYLTHPVRIAATFHFQFLNIIHPFWDGNGRMARLLSSLLLLKAGFPPLNIPASEKGKYIQMLILSEEDPERSPLVAYFIDRMITTLNGRLKEK